MVSKLVEKTLLKQILDHLKRNKLIPHPHHGAVENKSTQSLVLDLHDTLLEDYNNDTETALLVIDQSKAYNLVKHEILLGKLEIIGFNPKSIQTMKSYLENRKQFVEVQGSRSGNLIVGPQSVTQGSTLSCVFYLIYILDLPFIFHDQKHYPEEFLKCPNEKLKSYIDDNYIQVYKNKNSTLEQAV